MFGLGTTELLLILAIVIIFFGAGKLPELGAGVARGIKNFKKNLTNDDDDKSPKTADAEEKSTVIDAEAEKNKEEKV